MVKSKDSHMCGTSPYKISFFLEYGANGIKWGQRRLNEAKRSPSGPNSEKLGQLGSNRANLDQMGPIQILKNRIIQSKHAGYCILPFAERDLPNCKDLLKNRANQDTNCQNGTKWGIRVKWGQIR